MLTGGIQPSFTAQPQDILDGNHRKTRHRALRQPDKGPVHSILAASDQRFHGATLVIARCFPPSQRRVIIMRSRVDHAIGREPVGQINVCARITKSKLKHCHAWYFVVLSQRVHIGRDVAEVFSKERQTTKSLAQLDE